MWFLVVFLVLCLGGTCFLLWRATQRLLQFDELFQMIIDPMQEYRDVLKRITTAEGLLHDHPEVLAFHRANTQLLISIDAAVASVKESRPQRGKKKELPRPEAA